MLGRNYVSKCLLTLLISFLYSNFSHAVSFEQFQEFTKSSLNSNFSVSALDEPSGLAAHPSGDYFYVASKVSDSITAFKFDGVGVEFIENYKDGGNGIDGLNGAIDVIVSPDGRSVYVLSFVDGAIAHFQVNLLTGRLSFVRQYKNNTADVDGTTIHGLSYFFSWGNTDIDISPTGDFLYVSSTWKGGAIFKINKLDGSLSYLAQGFPGYNGSNKAIAVNSDGTEIVVLNLNADAAIVYSVNTITGNLTQKQLIKNNVNGVVGLNYPIDAIYVENRLYIVARDSDAVSVFEKDEADFLIQKQSIDKSSVGADGETLASLDQVVSLEVGVLGNRLHVVSAAKDAVTTFDIDSQSGLLSHTDTTFHTDSFSGNPLTGLDAVVELKRIPKSSQLIAVSGTKDRLSIFDEENLADHRFVHIVNPENERAFFEIGAQETLKAVSFDPVAGNDSRQLFWWNQEFETIAEGSHAILPPLQEGEWWYKAYRDQAQIILGETYSKVWLVVSNEVNQPPIITSLPPTKAYQGIPYEYQVLAQDDLDSILNYSLVNDIVGMQISPEGLITWTPSELQEGLFNVTIRVVDSAGHYTEQDYAVEVVLPSDSFNVSFISVPPASVQVGDVYEYQAIAVTNSETDIEYSIVVGPPDVDINKATGLISWHPASIDVGANPMIIKALDGLGNYIEQQFSVVVSDGLGAPQIVSAPPANVLESKPLEYFIEVYPESEHYSYQVSATSGNISIDDDGRIRWQHPEGITAPQTTSFDFCGISPRDPGLFDPVLKWHWQGGQVRITPLVAQLSDDNNDGIIDALDIPDVVFTAYHEESPQQGWLVVLDGETGSPVTSFQTPLERFHPYVHIAVGDIDDDDIVEIIAYTSEGELVAYDHYGGEPKWKVDRPNQFGGKIIPALYDLDGDGRVEIVISKWVFDASGNLLWVGEGDSVGNGNSLFDGDLDTSKLGSKRDLNSFAMDFLPNPGQEVIVGNQVYSAEGELLWTAEGASDGMSAMADLDSDGEPELVIQDQNRWKVVVVDSLGNFKWEYITQSHSSIGGPVTISDIDGDGFSEIGFATKYSYILIDHLGNEVWKFPIQDISSGLTGSTVFDFEGDGEADIVYFDEEYLRVFDKNGNVKFRIENVSGTWVEYPVIADIDNDNHADIVIPSSDSNDVMGIENTTVGVRAFHDRYNTWPDTRSIWNQHAYHIDNVNDDGTIPRYPRKSYLTHNTFRLSAFQNRAGQEQLDLTLRGLVLGYEESVRYLSVDLVNRTPIAINEAISVTFYLGEPENGVVLGVEVIDGINANEFKNVKLMGVDSSDWNQNIYAVLDYPGLTPECNTGNNQIVGSYIYASVMDDRDREDSQEFIVTVLNHNLPPSVSEIPSSQVLVGHEFTYSVSAHDENVNDQLNYQVVDSPKGMRIDSDTGLISWFPTNQDVGNNQIRVRVTDSVGNKVDSRFNLQVIHNENENHVPYITNVHTIFTSRVFRLDFEYFDEDDDAITYEILSAPSGYSFNGTSISWNPYYMEEVPDYGLYHIKVRVTDEHGLYSDAVYPVWFIEDYYAVADIEAGEHVPPEIVVETKELVFIAGEERTYALPMPDGVDGYSYEKVSGPGNLFVENNTIRWNPSFYGDYETTVRLTNGVFSYEYTIPLSARRNENRPPVLTSGFPSILYVNEPFEYQFEYSDPDEDPVTFEVLNKPNNASIDESGLLTWMPTKNEIGDQQIQIVLNDTVGFISTNTIAFEVREFRNRAPSFTRAMPPFHAVVGAPYEYQFLATDLDGDHLTFSIADAPSSASIDATGLLTIPSVTIADVADYEVKVKAEDPHGASETITYTLFVNNNTAPSFSNVPSTIAQVGENYWYGPRANDIEGHSFNFELVSGPDNVDFDASSGEIHWRPTDDQVGEQVISIRVVDEFGEQSTQAIPIYVYSAKIMDRNVCPAPSFE
ncbi:MAG: putative Ig domain-containing protein [Pseudomonadales bacterium]|nr:putative Ig domain-containing protein [Pseudomonadales bacterium]